MHRAENSMLSDDDITAITSVHNDWIRRELAGNARALVDLCTDDAVLMPPGQVPVTGRAAVGAWLGQPGPEILSLEANIRLLRGSGAVAYKVASFRSSYRDTATGHTQTVTGSHLWILERTGAGLWRVALVTWDLHG
jgi:ketosteroid isomerase-like protein